MKKMMWLFGVALAGVGLSGEAQASPFWTQVPGITASQIGVGASNYPFVMRSDGRVFYGKPACAGGSNICIPITQWVDTGGVGATLSVSINGWPWLETSGKRFYFYTWATGVSRWDLQPVLTVPGGAPACMGAFVVSNTVSNPELLFPLTLPTNTQVNTPNIWGTDCAGQTLYELDANVAATIFGSTWVSTQFFQLDTGGGDHGVAIFSKSVGTSVSQSPWFLSRYGIAYAWDGSTVVEAGAPASKHDSITNMTDHFVVAAGELWRWNGDIHGRGTGISFLDWTLIIGAPTGQTLSKIAYSSTLPNTQQGTAGPSSVWALDTNGNVYRLDSASDVVPK